ncbi:hypothetical protein JQ580_33475 [Bradyrhizobium japonicum]|jgi:hypothetical protein|uniref:hypothetical protein n=1 Tax=Bradyrhizobium japonicum TaxID=375 RepID=UPI001BAC46BB|nr:hypothetical protein [Bradyrhizobium japonicum]MBR0995627.1 hypothetical protein [Bradyrhizobium japonicum]
MNTLLFPELRSADLAFKLMSESEVGRLLEPFYLSLSRDARQVRFGHAISNESIVCYCARFRASKAFGFGCLSGAGLISIVELHPFGGRGELAFASAADGDSPAIYRRLLLLTAVTAESLACRSLIVASDLIEPQVSTILRELGDLNREPATGFLELTGFAREKTGPAAEQADHA